MTYTILPNSDLRINISPEEMLELRQSREESEDNRFSSDYGMYEVFDSLVSNSELQWVSPATVGALTDAPLLGIYGDGDLVENVWGFMDYALTSPQDQLADEGYVIFQSGDNA